MSGQTIGTFVVGAIGLMLGGNWQAGAMIGGMIGSSFDTIQGPQLGDIPVQTSQEGAFCPIVFGAPGPFPGNIIQQGEKIKGKKKERQGKSGPKVKSDTVHQTFAIRICEGPAVCMRIWVEGKLAFSRYEGDELDADTAAFMSRITLYEGTEDQLPDPSLEALPGEYGGGAGNVPAYTRVAYMVASKFDLTPWAGRIPQFEFEMASGGVTVVPPSFVTCGEQQNYGGGETFPTVVQVEMGECIGRVDVMFRTGAAPDKLVIELDGVEVYNTGYIGNSSYQSALDANLAARGLPPELIYPGTVHVDFGNSYPPPFEITSCTQGEGCEFHASSFYKTTSASTATVRVYGPLPNTAWAFYVACPDSSDLPAGWMPMPDSPGWVVSPEGEVFANCDAPTVEHFDPDTVYLGQIEQAIARRVGIKPSQFDVSQIAAIPVEGYLIGQLYTAADNLKPLQLAYFHDLPEYDLQLHAVVRGGEAVLTLVDDDFVDDPDEDTNTRRQAIEVPRKLILFFSDPSQRHVKVPVEFEREARSIPSQGTQTLQLPLVLDRDEAQQKVNIMGAVAWEQAQDRMVRTLPFYRFAELTCADCVMHGEKRWLLTKAEIMDGRMRIEAVRDRVSNYTNEASAPPVITPPPPESNLLGPTVFRAMNLPRLRTADVGPGMYLAATGRLAGWDGADIYLSVDGGVSEQLVAAADEPNVMGILTQALGSTGEPLVVRVYDGRELVDATDAQIAARANAIALTSSNVSEVAQFQFADQDSEDLWELTGLRRNLLGTDAGTYAAGDSFVALDGSPLFLPIDIAHAGKTLIFRAVTRGTEPVNNPTFEIVYLPQFLGGPTYEPYLDDAGEPYKTANGTTYYRVT